ncbi:hypothetical protein [Massilimicrobiota timonensis]|uniref:hypothetical protein n=1 Tax=Massilimicrobiota timonensis TaxID=1776392 RepID=UPI00195FB11A|nr:hypothetical protein [Massilimicrobiota timonensis]
MANEGKRCYCRCIQDMRMQIGKEELTIFHHNKIYACMVRTGDMEVSFYKIYGEEFSLSCSEAEFKEYFRFVKYRSSDEKS